MKESNFNRAILIKSQISQLKEFLDVLETKYTTVAIKDASRMTACSINTKTDDDFFDYPMPENVSSNIAHRMHVHHNEIISVVEDEIAQLNLKFKAL